MKNEYEFSKFERGKFYRRSARLMPPVHLEEDVITALAQEASRQGVSLSDLANRLLRHELDASKQAD